jgi:hypothetical protein
MASEGNGALRNEKDTVKGYEIEDILRLIQLQREIYLTNVDIAARLESSDGILGNEQGPIAKVGKEQRRKDGPKTC